MIIRNAGFMWHRQFVDWKKRKLIGYPEKGNADAIDFADQAAIYGLYDRNNICVYIGQAGSGEKSGLYDRLKDHTENYLFCMWERFSWYGFYSEAIFGIEESLKARRFEAEYKKETNINEIMTTIETIAIHLMLPKHNRSMGMDIKEIEWYYQKEEFENK